MTSLDRYIEEVLRDVLASDEDRARLESDLRSHFAAAEERGEPPARILEEMGRPQDVAAAFNAERPLEYAGFFQRLVAFVGDFGLLTASISPAVAIAVWSQANLEPGASLAAGWVAALALGAMAVFGLFVFYFPILEARFGKTLGKHLLRLRVVRESGAPIGLGQAFVRRLSLYFELLVPDALFVPFTDKRQRALDIIARTVVVREPGERAPLWAWALCLLLPVGAMSLLALIALLCGG